MGVREAGGYRGQGTGVASAGRVGTAGVEVGVEKSERGTLSIEICVSAHSEHSSFMHA